MGLDCVASKLKMRFYNIYVFTIINIIFHIALSLPIGVHHESINFERVDAELTAVKKI